MYVQQFNAVNEGIEKTKRVVIGLGCSFAQGQGAIDDELYEQYKFTVDKLGIPAEAKLMTREQKLEIIKNNELVTMGPEEKLDFTFMEYKNAFVDVLCNKYLDGRYTPMNLGIRGCGNRATIKDLYMYPQINWGGIEDIVVVYMPSGLERFDFIADTWTDHAHFKCMWPHYQDEHIPEGPRKTMWKGYAEYLWSEKFEVMEQICHVQELMTWCQAKKAKLIVVPGFDTRYNKRYFLKHLRVSLARTMDGEILESHYLHPYINYMSDLINQFPWENMWRPGNYETFLHLVMGQEDEKTQKTGYWDFLGKGTPGGWLTPCCHPSAKGHDLLAKHLYDYLIEKNYLT